VADKDALKFFLQEMQDLLDDTLKMGHRLVIIEGEARGADILAREWAKARNIPHIPCKADWDRLGKAAGLIRNRQMLDDHRPHFVLAFPGGTGTAHMCKIARAAKVPVREATPQRIENGNQDHPLSFE
jgi:hypothetical protein